MGGRAKWHLYFVEYKILNKYSVFLQVSYVSGVDRKRTEIKVISVISRTVTSLMPRTHLTNRLQ